MSTAVTIVGAGPVGTLLALLLARAGRRVRLVERRADPRLHPPERGRSINLALAARGLVALEAAGVLARVRSGMIEMRGRQVHEPGGREAFLPYGQHAGEVIHAISRGWLNAELIAAAAGQPLIDLRFGQRCLDVDPATGTAQWRDEDSGALRSEAAPLLIGADGAGSAVRAALVARGAAQATEDPLEHDYKELHIPPAAGGGPALAQHALHIWPRGGYMLIALPNTDGSFTATLFLAARGGVSFESLREPQAARAFFAAQFPDALALIPDFDAQFASHPTPKLATLYCWPWHRQRVLLIGDAAHAIVPFHGQGLNCGFEDCVLLARLLADAGDAAADAGSGAGGDAAGDTGGDGSGGTAALQGACARFERERRPDTDAIAAMAIENYQEMRARVLAPDFLRRRELAAALEQRFARRFIPRYSMVMFHPEIGYAEAQRRGALQEQVLDALLAAHPALPVGPWRAATTPRACSPRPGCEPAAARARGRARAAARLAQRSDGHAWGRDPHPPRGTAGRQCRQRGTGRFVAARLQLARRQVRLVGGLTSRRKLLEIEGLAEDTLRAQLLAPGVQSSRPLR